MQVDEYIPISDRSIGAFKVDAVLAKEDYLQERVETGCILNEGGGWTGISVFARPNDQPSVQTC